MADVAEQNLNEIAERDVQLGAEAARLVWEDAPEIDEITDPRTPAFARGVIDGLAASLSASPGAVRWPFLADNSSRTCSCTISSLRMKDEG